jgi:anti-sigma B factor antagonist
MSTADFMVDVRRDGDATVVAPSGELDLVTVGALREELKRFGADGPLVLDLRGLSFMDSAGVALIVEQQRRAESEGFDFRVVRGSGLVQQLLEVTGLAAHLHWTE